MGLQIITAEQRLAEKRGHKIVVCGQSGVGKTTLARTLNPDTTLFMDLEAGDAAIEGYAIDVIRPKTWAECRDFACYIGGPNPSLSDDQPYGKAHYDYVCQTYGDPDGMLSKYDTIFVDSITVAGRLCFQYCQQQPESRSDRTGKLDTRAAYGMHGREMMAWLTHLQHIRAKNVIFVGILDESTDDYGRKQYALQIEGSNPLKLQLQQQEQWVSDVAHELKTPITALRLVSESLSLKAEGRQAVLVERLEKELERLQKLVGDLLDLSRLDNALASRSRPPAALDPRDVIGQAWSTLQELAIPRGIELQIEPKRDQARQVCVEPARLHQALFNLIDNALRYSPDGKSIDLSIEERDRWCLIAVRDHGPGFSATDLDRMFERFYRGDPARARGPRNGSGLGLAIVRQIALSQGGLVRARNHPGGGAVVELLLPRA